MSYDDIDSTMASAPAHSFLAETTPSLSLSERISNFFLGDGYEGIYLAIGIAATGLFVIETLIRVYRIYDTNNGKRRKRRKRRATEDDTVNFKSVLVGISEYQNKYG